MAQVAEIPTKVLIRLLREVDPIGSGVVQIVDRARLAVGAGSMAGISIIDLATESIESAKSARTFARNYPAKSKKRDEFAVSRLKAPAGKYLLQVGDEVSEHSSLKELLAAGLSVLEMLSPGTLEKLSAIKPRSKRIVARNRNDLFESNALAAQYGERLNTVWWFGTNNSSQETNSWLRRGCEMASLKWGSEFNTSL
jgi:hypothetical protein